MLLIYLPSLVSLSITTVTGLILPGPCPEMPPTHNASLRLNHIGTYRAFIPFTETPSWIFGELPPGSINCRELHFGSRNKEWFVKSTSNVLYFSGFDTIITLNLSSSIGEAAHVATGIITWSKSLPLCQAAVLNETFRFWIHGYYGVIWSCVEMKDKGSHDEALILTISKKSNETDRKQQLKKLREYAEIYIKNPLRNRISFVKPVKISSCDGVELVPCPYQRTGAYYTAVVLVAVIAGSCLMCIFILHFYDTRNQVEPMES